MYRRVGLGDTSTVSQSPAACTFFSRAADPLCLTALIDGEFVPGYNAQVAPMITQAYVAGAVPGAPPSQATIDSQPAQDTVDQILSQSQQNATTQAIAAAAAQAASNAPALPTACIADPTSIACWVSQNSTVLIIGGVLVGAVVLLGVVRH